jgi:NAD(P)-dependent dehydrogenase (short-subunit alcohol dehydrogenase family)
MRPEWHSKILLMRNRCQVGCDRVSRHKNRGDAAFVRTDVAKDADVKAMVDFTVDKFGRHQRWCVLNSMRYEIPAMLKNGGNQVNALAEARQLIHI